MDVKTAAGPGLGAVRNLDWMFKSRTANKLEGSVRCTNSMPLQMMAVASTKNEHNGNRCTISLVVKQVRRRNGAEVEFFRGTYTCDCRYATINVPQNLPSHLGDDAQDFYEYFFVATSQGHLGEPSWIEVVVCPDRATP